MEWERKLPLPPCKNWDIFSETAVIVHTVLQCAEWVPQGNIKLSMAGCKQEKNSMQHTHFLHWYLTIKLVSQKDIILKAEELFFRNTLELYSPQRTYQNVIKYKWIFTNFKLVGLSSHNNDLHQYLKEYHSAEILPAIF